LAATTTDQRQATKEETNGEIAELISFMLAQSLKKHEIYV